MLKTVLALTVAVVVLSLIGVVALAFHQGRKAPAGDPQYVALGSSFAAGMDLGPRDPGSPFVCMRTLNGYPKQLALLRGLSLVDVSCSGATTNSVLLGGKAFLRPQLDGLTARTELVTLTIGGNDVGYVGDLTLLAARGRPSFLGWYARTIWKGPTPPGNRDYEKLGRSISEILLQIRLRAPRAVIVVATYPTLLPPAGTCAKVGLQEKDVVTMRAVGDRLAEITKITAGEHGAVVVDMNLLGSEHHVCSEKPWAYGVAPKNGMPFHPNSSGAAATAEAVLRALRASRDQEPTSRARACSAGCRRGEDRSGE